MSRAICNDIAVVYCRLRTVREETKQRGVLDMGVNAFCTLKILNYVFIFELF